MHLLKVIERCPDLFTADSEAECDADDFEDCDEFDIPWVDYLINCQISN